MHGLHTELNKIRCLLNAVLGKKWATTPLKNIPTAQYNLDRLIMALNESIQPEREIQKASTLSKTYYGQLTNHFKDVRKYDSSRRSDSRNHGEY